MIIGVLALQGDFREHREALQSLGVKVVEVRTPEDLDQVDALVLPGGESTAMSKLLDSSGLFDAIGKRLSNESLPTFGTCAGMILSAAEVLDGVAEQRQWGQFDAVVRRNGIGRQIASFEAAVVVKGLDTPMPGIFIRPPVVEKVGDDVEVLADWEGRPILCRQGSHLFATFHPELTNDARIHQLFLENAKA